jgi:hypothetical protein
VLLMKTPPMRRFFRHSRSSSHAGWWLAPALALVLQTAAGSDLEDARESVDLPAPLRAELLSHMRDHLAAIEGVSRLLAAGDYAAAADTAESRLGMSAIGTHGGPHIGRHFPEGMRAIGMGMHRAASRFATVARDAEVGGDLGAVFNGLADVMAQCVACHNGYRVR